MTIVTDSALMYAYAIDPQNREFKAPFSLRWVGIQRVHWVK